jgi:predicted glycosyl hydrolase (DUF1957 family)
MKRWCAWHQAEDGRLAAEKAEMAALAMSPRSSLSNLKQENTRAMGITHQKSKKEEKKHQKMFEQMEKNEQKKAKEEQKQMLKMAKVAKQWATNILPQFDKLRDSKLVRGTTGIPTSVVACASGI